MTLPRSGSLRRTQLRSKPAHSPVASWHQAEVTRLVMAGLNVFDQVGAELGLAVPFASVRSKEPVIPLEVSTDPGFGFAVASTPPCTETPDISAPPSSGSSLNQRSLIFVELHDLQVAMTLLMLYVSPADPQDNHAGALTEVHPVHHQRDEIETATTSVSRATDGGSSCQSTTSALEARNRFCGGPVSGIAPRQCRRRL